MGNNPYNHRERLCSQGWDPGHSWKSLVFMGGGGGEEKGVRTQ